MEEFTESSRCRLCFSDRLLSADDGDADVAIFPPDGPPNQSLIAMIYECTSIRIGFERDHAYVVCGQCLQMLQQFHGYRRRCLANASVLRRERGDGAGDEVDDDDPLQYVTARIKREDGGVGGRDEFCRTLKRQIRVFLEAKTKEIERKAMAKVDEAMRDRPRGMDSEDEDGVDWRGKYLTLQRNNELLQQAFKEQKSKLKETEQLLKRSQKQPAGSNNNSSFEVTDAVAAAVEEPSSQRRTGRMFTTHPAIPEISTEFLYNLNYNSGPGEKGDRNFVSKLAVAVFGEEVLVNSSVTGRPSNAHHNIPPKPPLCPQKLAAIEAKLYERVELEVGRFNRSELVQRSSEKVVRLVVCQKSMNLRKQVMKRNQSGGGDGSGNASFGEDDPAEDAAPSSAKRRAM